MRTEAGLEEGLECIRAIRLITALRFIHDQLSVRVNLGRNFSKQCVVLAMAVVEQEMLL